MVEMAMLVGAGFYAAQALAPQSTAVWPYDSYHDLRWLLVYHDSWQAFVAGLLVVIVVRGLLSAALTGLSWPQRVPRPSIRWLVKRNLEVAALATVIISPWAALSVAFSAVALSWYLFASVIPMLVIAPFLQRAGVVARWWKGLPSVQLLAWSIVNFLVITAASAAIVSVPDWWRVPVAGLAGAANGLLWRRTVTAAALHRRLRWATVPVAPLAIVVTMVAAVGVPPLLGVASGTTGQWRPPIVVEPLPQRVPYAVIVLAGFESSWNGQEPADPRVERFSYRGLDRNRRPLPYPSQATHRSLDSSAVLLAAQVDALHARTRRPVALAGESEGALVIRTYLEKLPRGPVEAALLFSPLILPGRVYYPPPGHEGWGVVTGWQLRAIAAITNLTRRVDNDPDEPFVRSVIVEAPFYRNRILCPVPEVRMMAFLPLISAAEAPSGEYTHIPVVEVPALHGGLLSRRSIHERAIAFLSGEPVSQPWRGYELLQRLGAAWQAPPLVLALNPIWVTTREGDPALSGRICRPR
ncbi:hypothetical protein [Micromonospora sp. A200]|uniref:hypothetical protein n=1 Tax=Micromonospora sp. A200 TaxID=2940568 RepID=UPI002474BC37|nr:hypothetical protein [Micromonospora sp. A200]